MLRLSTDPNSADEPLRMYTRYCLPQNVEKGPNEHDVRSGPVAQSFQNVVKRSVGRKLRIFLFFVFVIARKNIPIRESRTRVFCLQEGEDRSDLRRSSE